ncbi:hypothetical protein HJG60_011089 [Phyllostomus discolor]|uniref:Uncharacterized protein n=1 Tax=Phyllostomus discolor TaxID=89673 RepID=A0A834A1S4_9CHIR|nr:hypothetical protein HJG60_011089 [Phyllostomus discolor]
MWRVVGKAAAASRGIALGRSFRACRGKSPQYQGGLLPSVAGDSHVPSSSGDSAPRAGSPAQVLQPGGAPPSTPPAGRGLHSGQALGPSPVLRDATAGEHSCAGLLSSVPSGRPPRRPHWGGCVAPVAEAAFLTPTRSG